MKVNWGKVCTSQLFRLPSTKVRLTHSHIFFFYVMKSNNRGVAHSFPGWTMRKISPVLFLTFFSLFSLSLLKDRRYFSRTEPWEIKWATPRIASLLNNIYNVIKKYICNLGKIGLYWNIFWILWVRNFSNYEFKFNA